MCVVFLQFKKSFRGARSSGAAAPLVLGFLSQAMMYVSAREEQPVCVCACVCACVCVCVCVVGWLVGFPSFLSLLFPPPLFLLILTTHFFFHLLAMALSSSASSFLCTRAPTPLSPLLLTAVRPGKRAARVRGAAFGQLL